MKAEIIKPEVAAKELREMGMRINAQNIRYGLREGKFPFGVAINMGKQWEYLIYRKLINCLLHDTGSQPDDTDRSAQQSSQLLVGEQRDLPAAGQVE